MYSSATIRVVVADPQPVFRYGLRRLLDETEYLRVVGEAGDTAQATAAVRQFEADVLVISPGRLESSLDALKGLDELPKPVRCIVMTNGQHDAPAAAWPPPVVGALPRESSGAAFVMCIQGVMENHAWPGGDAAPLAAAGRARNGTTPFHLTAREVQIVCAAADGASNKEIAAQFSIAEDTVKRHLSNVFNKVGVDSRHELTVFALYHRLVEWA